MNEWGALVEWQTEVLGELPLCLPQIPYGLSCERVRCQLSSCSAEYQGNCTLHNAPWGSVFRRVGEMGSRHFLFLCVRSGMSCGFDLNVFVNSAGIRISCSVITGFTAV